MGSRIHLYMVYFTSLINVCLNINHIIKVVTSPEKDEVESHS